MSVFFRTKQTNSNTHANVRLAVQIFGGHWSPCDQEFIIARQRRGLREIFCGPLVSRLSHVPKQTPRFLSKDFHLPFFPAVVSCSPPPPHPQYKEDSSILSLFLKFYFTLTFLRFVFLFLALSLIVVDSYVAHQGSWVRHCWPPQFFFFF